MDTSPFSRLFRLLPVAAGISLFGLAGASPTSAQKLTLGDFTNPGTATISGGGTTAAGIYSFSGGAGPGTKAYQEVDLHNPSFFGATPDLTLQTGGSITDLVAAGGTAAITGGSIGEASLSNNSGFNVQGGSVQSITATQDSQVNVSGGTVGSVDAGSTSAVKISGGSVGTAGVGNDTQLFITGGTVQLAVNNEGSLSISGGNVTKAQNFANDFGTSASVSGGTVGTLENDAGCQTYVSGGKFQFIVNNAVPFGGFIDITGTDLKAIQYGGPGPYDALLTGTLSNGDVLDALYAGGVGDGTLEFNGSSATLSAPVPEVSSVISLGLLLCLGMGGLAASRRRKKDTA